MPHQCTNCGRLFDDGSKEMLSGCPDCGGNKFQFCPDREAASENPSAEPPEPPDPPGGSTVAETVGRTAATVRDLVGDSPDAPERESPAEATAPEAAGDAGAVAADVPDPGADVSAPGEDRAQASARSDVVAPDDLPSDLAESDDRHRFRPVDADDESTTAGAESTTVGAESTTVGAESTTVGAESTTVGAAPVADDPEPADRPDLQELREELNDQFESIRVLQPGRYELNLMELYDREEYIIALQEDGRYSIQVPDAIRE